MNTHRVKTAPRFLWMVPAAFFLCTSAAWAKNASLTHVKGEVEILKTNTADWIPAQTGTELENGDELRTGAKSSVRIIIESSEVTLEQKTSFRFNSHEVQNEKSATSLELMLGELKANVQKLKAGSEFKITTPTSVAAVRGTLFNLFVFMYLGELFTQLDVINGFVSFSDETGREPQQAGPGQSLIGGEGGNTANTGETENANGPFNSQEINPNPFQSQSGFQQDTAGSQDNPLGSPNPETASTQKSSSGDGIR